MRAIRHYPDSRNCLKIGKYMTENIKYIYGGLSEEETLVLEKWVAQSAANRVLFDELELLPGGNEAMLTLPDGTVVVLDKAEKGTIANQGAVLAYNTLTTPAAGQFEVLFPDGSRVWLNNALFLRYPVVSAEKDWEVELKGEGYCLGKWLLPIS